MSGNPVIRLQRVGKSYTSRAAERIEALADINLDVAQGTLVAIVGPTGCGKTTLLRLMAGLEPPDTGSIEVAAEGRDGASPFAYLTQEHSLFPWLQVRKNIELPMVVRGEAPSVMEATLQKVSLSLGLADYLNLYPHELSGGMQQRTALARLLATDAGTWLLDEPFSSLDEKTRHTLQDLLLRLQAERQRTIVFVTHTIDEAVYLADRVLVLSAHPGRMAADIEITSEKPRNRMSPEFGLRIEEIRQVIEKILI